MPTPFARFFLIGLFFSTIHSAFSQTKSDTLDNDIAKHVIKNVFEGYLYKYEQDFNVGLNDEIERKLGAVGKVLMNDAKSKTDKLETLITTILTQKDTTAMHFLTLASDYILFGRKIKETDGIKYLVEAYERKVPNSNQIQGLTIEYVDLMTTLLKGSTIKEQEVQRFKFDRLTFRGLSSDDIKNIKSAIERRHYSLVKTNGQSNLYAKKLDDSRPLGKNSQRRKLCQIIVSDVGLVTVGNIYQQDNASTKFEDVK